MTKLVRKLSPQLAAKMRNAGNNNLKCVGPPASSPPCQPRPYHSQNGGG